MATFTLTDRVRELSRPFLAPVADFLARLNVHPNAVSIAGFLGCVAVGAALALGHLRLAGLLLLLFGPLDAVDGLLARRSGKQSVFGAFLDSTLDRYAEIAIFGGLLYFALEIGAKNWALLSFFALTGSLMVSYARARAEALGLECKVGLLTRFERLAILTLGLLLEWVTFSLAIIAILANLTALQRMLHVYRATKK
ncbi:MAG: CDP-alcohol phosphatidyltransferase family protein [Thermodesulfobacteria bacterium]|nr:CDP-alcohol phosphatidyltransferase family protein [Thermodesulfobacteriota bacterium]